MGVFLQSHFAWQISCAGKDIVSYAFAGSAIGLVSAFLLCIRYLPDNAARVLFVTVPLGLGLLIVLAFGLVMLVPAPGPP